MRPSHARTIRSQSTPPAAPHNSLLRAGDRSVETRDVSLVQSTPCPFRSLQAAKPSNHGPVTMTSAHDTLQAQAFAQVTCFSFAPARTLLRGLSEQEIDDSLRRRS